jgi:excisionase family DNA binding protein
VEINTERGEWMTVREVQELLRIKSTKVYELVNTPGGIPNTRVGRSIRVHKQDLRDWLEQQKHPLSKG